MKNYFKALHGALGIKRYILGSIVLFIVGIYEALRVGFPELPNIPTWQIAIVLVLICLVWWILQRLVEVEKELEPNLEILFDNGSAYEITEPMNSEGHTERFFRVKVSNTSTRDLDNCLVMLEEMRTEDGIVYPNRYLPVGLTTDHQLLQRRRRGVFNLRGKQYKFIVVASLDEKIPESEITLLYENENYANKVPRNTYEIRLVVYGGGMPKRENFKISVDENGYLKMEKIISNDELA